MDVCACVYNTNNPLVFYPRDKKKHIKRSHITKQYPCLNELGSNEHYVKQMTTYL